MIPDPKHLTATTPEDDFPENLVAVAQRFFRWLCERENARLALRRFDDKGLKEEIDEHAKGTDMFVHDLGVLPELKTNPKIGYGGEEFAKFCEQENVDQEGFKEFGPALSNLRLRARLQFHLAYHDLHTGDSNPKFQFPMFKDVWAQTRSIDTPSNEYVPLEVRRRPGRPGIDYDWMAKGLLEMEEAEELPPLEGAWRSKIAQILLHKFMNNYDGSKPRKPPKMTTIRDGMRGEFDALQARDEKRYGTR